MTNASLSADTVEERRRKANELKEQGWKQSQIAEMLRVQPSTVSRWLNPTPQATSAMRGGKSSRGAPPKLTPEQLQEILFLLAKGPAAFGLPDLTWTRRTVCMLLEQSLGITISVDRIGVILEKAGWHLNPRITRLQISELKNQGNSPEEIAARLQVPLALVKQWFEDSEVIARRQKYPRRPILINSKLDVEQLQALAKLLLKPPTEYGLAAKSWTRKAICELIQQTYGVSFSINHIPHLLRRIKRFMYTPH